MCHIIIKHKGNDFLAQLVEQLTLNQWVEGSSPSEVTIKKLSITMAFFVLFWKLFAFIERTCFNQNQARNPPPLSVTKVVG